MKDDARRRRVVAICGAALDRSGANRRAFVSAACGDDEELRREVESVLVQASTGSFMHSIGSVAAQVVPGMPGMSLLGRQLGSYTIVSYLGAGGMGEVYRARDPRLARDVAIKILRVDFSPDAFRRRRFQREAQAIASLNHPHICVVYDVGQQDAIAYLVMEYLEGQTLKECLLDPTPLPLTDALTIAIEVASALVEAHRHGIVHRDVKPGNIMLTARGAKLLDFGLARTVQQADGESTDELTLSAAVLGTPSYMSPEQALGQTVDARTDVFSLGSVIYEMVTGRRSFEGVNVTETIDAVLHKQPPDVLQLRPDAPFGVGAVIAKCLAKDKEGRYQSVERLWTDLVSLRQGATPQVWIQTPAVRNHNLPVHVTSFVGRESEVAELCAMLADTRLVTLSGSGGCGKTRLGLKVAASMSGTYADGVWLAELAPVTDGSLIARTVASALGIEEEPGRPLVKRLADYLEAKELLLVLDNCEHLIDAAAQFVQAILDSGERVRVLATSREPLGIPWERVWRVPSLSFPDTASIPLPQVSDYEAVRLFVERAESVTPFELDEQNAGHVVEICRRLDGIPLALEMAAARLDVLSLDQIAGRLHDRFRLLTRTDRTSLPRHETLRGAIDWSYELLDPAEQTLFRRLAVFAGTFSLEAAERVCSDKNLRSEDVLEVLSRLVVKSMVTVGRTDIGVRYRLLETVREYALEKLRRDAGAHRTRDKHLEFFLAFAEPLEAEFFSRLTARAYDRVEQEHQNLLAALDWCHMSPRRSEKALRLVIALRPFWTARCYHQLGTQLSLRALDRDQRRSPKPVLIKALGTAAYFLRITGDLAQASLAHEESLRFANEVADHKGAANALCELGMLASMHGKDSEAERLFAESLAISRQHGLKLVMAEALDNLGVHAFHRRDYALAQSYWQESHELFRGLGFEIGITISLLHHAGLASRTDREKARSLCMEALSKARETGHRGFVTYALTLLGVLYVSSDRQRSRALYQEALSIARGVGYKRHIARALICLGHLSMIEGKLGEADRLYNEGFALYTQLHEDQSADAADCLEYLGWVALEQGRFRDALELCERARSLSGFRIGRGDSLRLLGWVRLGLGDLLQARAAFEESLAVADEAAHGAGVAGAQLGIGYVELVANHPSEARSRLLSALPLFEAENNHGRMVDALIALGDAALLEDQVDDAETLYVRAFRLACDLGHRKYQARSLRSLGIIASRQRRTELAARRFGAGKAMLEMESANFAPFELTGYDDAVNAVRAVLGSEEFQRLWDEGHAVSLDRIEALVFPPIA